MTPPPAAPQRPASAEDLFARFEALGIAATTTKHRPVFTVAEGADIKAQLPGGHSKNLFLKDKKGALFLLSALGETKIDLNAVSKLLGAGRFSFGSAELLMRHLGVTPGSVTVFALINDHAGDVTLILDEALFAHPVVNFHPLSNDATTALSPQDLLKFVRALDHEPIRLGFNDAGTPHRIEPEAGSAHLEG